MSYLNNKKRCTILTKTRSNLWGGLKIFKLNHLKWIRIKRQLKIKPQYLRFFKRRLKPQQQNARRAYKKLLFKKQNFKHYYGNIKESQFKTIFKKQIKKSNWKETQLNLVIQHLESRLDLVVFRMNFVNSINDAKNLILHGKVLVNGTVVKAYNFKVQPEDIISIHPQNKYVIFQKKAQNLYINNIYFMLILFPDSFSKNKFKTYSRLLNNQKLVKIKKNRRKVKKYLTFSIKKSNKLFLYKNKSILKILNIKKTDLIFENEYLNFFNKFNSRSHLIVNFKLLIGIFLQTPKSTQIFHNFMDLKSIQRYYDKQT